MALQSKSFSYNFDKYVACGGCFLNNSISVCMSKTSFRRAMPHKWYGHIFNRYDKLICQWRLHGKSQKYRLCQQNVDAFYYLPTTFEHSIIYKHQQIKFKRIFSRFLSISSYTHILTLMRVAELQINTFSSKMMELFSQFIPYHFS